MKATLENTDKIRDAQIRSGIDTEEASEFRRTVVLSLLGLLAKTSGPTLANSTLLSILGWTVAAIGEGTWALMEKDAILGSCGCTTCEATKKLFEGLKELRVLIKTGELEVLAPGEEK